MSSSVSFCIFIHNFLIILSEATIKERMTEQLPAFFQITTFSLRPKRFENGISEKFNTHCHHSPHQLSHILYTFAK